MKEVTETMIFLNDIYLKKNPILIRKTSEREQFEPENEESDFVDRMIGDIFVQTGYEIIVPAEIKDDLLAKFNWVIKELTPDLKSKMPWWLERYISDFNSFVTLGGDIEELNKKEKGLEEDLYDYSNMDSFWVSRFYENRFAMVECHDRLTTMEYPNENELSKDFSTLIYFLTNSQFIGREFRRTKPLKIGDRLCTSFMENSENIIALYASLDLIIAKQADKFVIIEGRFLVDGNYEFLGEIHNEYRDRRMVYGQIQQQVLSKLEIYERIWGSKHEENGNGKISGKREMRNDFLDGLKVTTSGLETNVSHDLSLKQLLEKLEGAYERASNLQGSLALMFAPEDAIDGVIEAQKKAYEKLIAKLETSSPQATIEVVKDVINSKYLTGDVKVALIPYGINSVEELSQHMQSSEPPR